MPKRRKRKEKERKILVEETLTTSDDLERSFVIKHIITSEDLETQRKSTKG